MTLAAEERRQWRELERQLAAEEPLLVQLTGGRGTKHRTAGSTGALVMVLVAFVVLILAVMTEIPLIGVLGLVLMIVGGSRVHLSGHKDQLAEGQPKDSGGVV
ncbi:DUF3040 domain-containing protein [Arthrobacter sp. NPDC092385]|uniref:DUF3040 domain-containing protein n=1 Tax=Arthrobacter sp. NPDC092385 TaxID=3363943 RepID=UPI003820629B